MADVTFRLDRTGLLVVDPYNDFISEGGKLWPRVREVVEANGNLSPAVLCAGAVNLSNFRGYVVSLSYQEHQMTTTTCPEGRNGWASLASF
jgi:hypothetical protein